MIRRWVDLAALVTDVIPLPLLILLMFLGASLVGVLWYTWPSWIPTRWPSLAGWLRRRRRDRSGQEEIPLEPVEPEALPEEASEDLPDRPAAELTHLADRLAAEGRYAEAVRERLRAIVRQLVETGVIGHSPGWTVTELTDAASGVRQHLGPPLREACGLFSDLWYGLHEAGPAEDDRMRHLAAAVNRLLTEPAQAAAGSGTAPGGQQ
ncbi:MAG: DUF4129 domain-containing protein [Micromonosporaceae bacterium]|nr:DUF4129 domain-containing protein [Micromonosporaceae bacterium]